jgi:hypothetical protein
MASFFFRESVAISPEQTIKKWIIFEKTFHRLKQKKIILLISLLAINAICHAQINEGLIELGKTYRQYMFRNNAPAEVSAGLDKYSGTALGFVADFTRETTRENNSLLTEKFLSRPGDSTLKYVYIIRQINYNVRKEDPEDNRSLVEKLLNKDVPVNELVDCYYEILFTGCGNKNKPFDLSGVNFDLKKYHFNNDTEQGIFFLQAMRLCGTLIWGYMNVVKPPNYNEAMKYIEKYPKFNSAPYYQYLDLNFPDFKMKIESEKKAQSYKEYYIDKYYETLIYHLQCLQQDESNKEKINDLILGSILKEEMYYKYSKQEKALKNLFTTYKK